MHSKVRLKINRYSPESKISRYDTFELEVKPGMTVLSALFVVQDRFDDSLSFRYSCRGAVCGTCAMLINKVPRLACRTQLSELLKESNPVDQKLDHNSNDILIKPLPYLPILKDLIVDMDKFFEQYRKVEPVLRTNKELLEKELEQEYLMNPSVVTDLENYTNCVLCAVCYSACPVNGKDPEYLGPAALAKLVRFHIDPRNIARDEILKLANNKSGFWGCEFHLNCKRVCPKGVQPNLAIGKARKRLKELGWVERENK